MLSATAHASLFGAQPKHRTGRRFIFFETRLVRFTKWRLFYLFYFIFYIWRCILDTYGENLTQGSYFIVWTRWMTGCKLKPLFQRFKFTPGVSESSGAMLAVSGRSWRLCTGGWETPTMLLLVLALSEFPRLPLHWLMPACGLHFLLACVGLNLSSTSR